MPTILPDTIVQVALLALLPVLSACTLQPLPAWQEPQWHIVTARADTVITVASTPDQSVFDVVSPSGIGGAQFAVVQGSIPERLILRFHLEALEELRFRHDDVEVIVAVSTQGSGAVRQSRRILTNRIPNDPDDGETPLSPDSPDWMQVETRTDAGDVVITMQTAANFTCRRDCSFSIEWVDFFR